MLVHRKFHTGSVEMSPESRMYSDRASLNDLIYHAKDYASEATRLCQLLRQEGVDEGSRVPEAACGSGRYLEVLERHFQTTGFDLNEEMLEIARKRAPDSPVFVADMAELQVDQPFDALLCLFSSIGYIHGTDRLLRTVSAFADALRVDGVLVIEPWVSPDVGIPGHPVLMTYEDDDLKVCRAFVTRAEGRRSILDFHWLVAQRDVGVEHLTERHELYMYTRQELLDRLSDAGFRARFEPDGLVPGRGLIVGRKL